MSTTHQQTNTTTAKQFDLVERIATMWNGCDIADDPSAMKATSLACEILGWSWEWDEFHQVKIVKGTKSNA